MRSMKRDHKSAIFVLSLSFTPNMARSIRSVHLSESVTITAFWGEKGESQLDEKGNVFNTFNMHDNIYSPFRPLSHSWIPIRSVALAATLTLHASNRVLSRPKFSLH